jgi:hypothetical protein
MPQARNKQFEEGYWKDIHISKCFHKSKPKLYVLIFHNQAAKNLKTIGAYKESTDLIFKTFKQIIHLVTQSI